MRSGQWLGWTFILVVLMLVVVSVIGRLAYQGPAYSAENYQIDAAGDTLIIGASHAATALNPDHLDGAISVARSGEPLFFTYYKTRQLLASNPGIERVIVALSSIHVCGFADYSFFSGNSASRIQSMNYYPLLDDEKDPLLPIFSADRLLSFLKYKVGVPFNYMDDTKVVLKHYTGSLQPNDFRFFGGFESFDETHLESAEVLEKAAFYFYGDDDVPVLSEVGRESIRRLFTLSESHDVDVFVIRTPEHASFWRATPQLCQDEYLDVVETGARENERVQFYDYGKLELPDDHFLDGDHLNQVGSEVFSKLLQARMTQSGSATP